MVGLVAVGGGQSSEGPGVVASADAWVRALEEVENAAAHVLALAQRLREAGDVEGAAGLEAFGVGLQGQCVALAARAR